MIGGGDFGCDFVGEGKIAEGGAQLGDRQVAERASRRLDRRLKLGLDSIFWLERLCR